MGITFESPNPEGQDQSAYGKTVSGCRSPRYGPVLSPSTSMCSLLSPRLYVRRGEFPSTRVTRQWRRAPIHFWHYIRQEFPHGQAKFLKYEDLAVPDIESQEISLWSGKSHLGLVPVKEVINDYLGPGTMLCLKGEPPTKKSHAVPESYDYEVRRIKASSSPGFKRGQVKSAALGAKSLHMDAFTHPFRLGHLLDVLYRYLDTTSGAVEIPVEFHLTARPRPGLTGLSLFTWGRVDLHPAVLLRAMPEGTFQILGPKVDFEGGDALWVVAPKDLRIQSVALPKHPHEVASMLEKVVVKKREWLQELTDAGDLTPSGKLTAKGKLNPRRQFGLNKQCQIARGRGEKNEEEPKDHIMDKLDEVSTDLTRLP